MWKNDYIVVGLLGIRTNWWGLGGGALPAASGYCFALFLDFSQKEKRQSVAQSCSVFVSPTRWRPHRYCQGYYCQGRFSFSPWLEVKGTVELLGFPQLTGEWRQEQQEGQSPMWSPLFWDCEARARQGQQPGEVVLCSTRRPHWMHSRQSLEVHTSKRTHLEAGLPKCALRVLVRATR